MASRIAAIPTGIALLLAAAPAPARAAIALTDASAYTETFQSFTGSGFSQSPLSGQLNSNNYMVQGMSDGAMGFGDTRTAGDFARGQSNGGVNTGGIYAFNVGGGDIALGVQPTGDDFTPGAIYVKLQNLSGSAFDGFAASYGLAVRNDQPRANSFNWQIAISPNDLANPTGLAYTTLSSYTSAAAASGSFFTTTLVSITSALVIPADSFIYLRWQGNDVSGSSNRDEFGITEFTFDPTDPPPTNAVPEPSGIALGLVGGLALAVAARRRRGRPSR